MGDRDRDGVIIDLLDRHPPSVVGSLSFLGWEWDILLVWCHHRFTLLLGKEAAGFIF